MSHFGREDAFLSGAIDGVNPRVDEVVLKALRVASIPVYCAKNSEHVMRIVDIGRSETCPICKRAGIESDVYVTQAIPQPVFRALAQKDGEGETAGPGPDDDGHDEDESKKKGKRYVTGDEDDEKQAPQKIKRAVAKAIDEVETGGLLDGQPIMTSKSRTRRPWTGERGIPK